MHCLKQTAISITTIYYKILAKTTASQNEVALNYHVVRGLYFLAVVFVATIVIYSCISLVILFIFLQNLLSCFQSSVNEFSPDMSNILKG